MHARKYGGHKTSFSIWFFSLGYVKLEQSETLHSGFAM